MESEYRDQTHKLFIARENLMAEGNAPAEDVPAGAQLANPTKKKREKLVISMRTQLAQLQDDIGRLPPGSMARIQALEGEYIELVSAWEWSEELTRKLQETGIRDFDDLTTAQDDLDVEFDGPLEKARIDIIAKRTECEVLFEETAAAERATERSAEITRATARKEAQENRAIEISALTTSAVGVGAR